MSTSKVIEAKNLTKHFPLAKGFVETLFSRKKSVVHAVDGINFDIRERGLRAGWGKRKWKNHHWKARAQTYRAHKWKTIL